MATYAVGDVQGCYQALRCLLDTVSFDRDRDRLWFTGDLVNRGPQSLEVLRFVRDLDGVAVTVLGNHDLHLLAVAQGVRGPHRKDTFEAILAAPDRDELLEWLIHRPLLHHENDYLMVHAGLPPQWSLQDAIALAAEVQQALRGPERTEFFAAMYGNEPDCWDAGLRGPERWRVITNYLTRMRLCTSDGRLDLECKGSPADAPPGFIPWFDHPHRLTRDTALLFGHWAALQGKAETGNVFALDTGCVWGGRLRAMRLEDRCYFHCEC